MSCNDESENITCDISSYPPSPNYVGLQNIINVVLGIGANIVGIPYKVYRVTSASQGDVIQEANLIYSAFPMERRKYKTDNSKDRGLETLTKDVFIYSILGNLAPLKVGDICIQNDPVYGQGYTSTNYETYQFNGMCIADLAPLKARISARVDRQIQIYRAPRDAKDNGYYSQNIRDCDRVVCIDGEFVLRSPKTYPDAVSSFVVAGFQADKRQKSVIVEDNPNMPPRASYSCYVMPLPGANPDGFTFKEGDKLLDQDGAMYVVTNPYRQDTGFVGSCLTVERFVQQR